MRDEWTTADREGRNALIGWALVLALAFVVAIKGCGGYPPVAYAAPSSVPWAYKNNTHDCHLKTKTEWTEPAIILQRGFDGTDRILLVQLDGCQCVLYVPEWAPDALSFPTNQVVWIRGITIGAPGSISYPMVLGVDEAA